MVHKALLQQPSQTNAGQRGALDLLEGLKQGNKTPHKSGMIIRIPESTVCHWSFNLEYKLSVNYMQRVANFHTPESDSEIFSALCRKTSLSLHVFYKSLKTCPRDLQKPVWSTFDSEPDWQ